MKYTNGFEFGIHKNAKGEVTHCHAQAKPFFQALLISAVVMALAHHFLSML